MSSCPKCQQPVDALAISCPHCKNPLKAYGHPGIPLYQSTDNTSLCDRCTYHLDDTCNFPKRPNATSCTLFKDVAILSITEAELPHQLGWRGIKNWLYRYRGLIAIALLVILSIAITLIQT